MNKTDNLFHNIPPSSYHRALKPHYGAIPIMEKYGIFTLNLERSPDRRERFMAQAEKASVAFEFFNAVDGLGKAVADFDSYNSKKRIKKYFFDMEPTEVACYLSHYNCIKNAHDRGLEKVVIFEDDISFGDNFKEVLDYCLGLDDRFEMVRLFGLKNQKSIKLAKIGHGYSLVVPLNTLCGAQGYILNRNGMKKVLDYGKEITVQFDIMIDTFWENGLTIFAVDPHPITEAQTSASTINIKPAENKWREKGYRHLRWALRLGKARNSFLKRLAGLAIIFRVLSGQMKV